MIPFEQITKAFDKAKFRNLSHTFEGDLSALIEGIKNKLDSDINPLSSEYKLECFVGTDSCRHGVNTKFSTCFVIHWIGHGGIAYYTNLWIKTKEVGPLRDKLWSEALLSVRFAQLLEETVKNYDTTFEIHLDINSKIAEKSNAVVKEITSYVQGNGFANQIKPDACVASHVADSLSR